MDLTPEQAENNEREANRLEAELQAKIKQMFPTELARIEELRVSVRTFREQRKSKNCRSIQPPTPIAQPQALDVVCPLCSAPVGQQCTGTGGAPHAMRVRKAQGAA
jgi:hypothetical protein